MADTTINLAPRANSRRNWILVAVCLGQFMIQLDLTVVNVALPDIARTIGGSTSTLQWVVDAYNLAVAALLLSGGRAGDRVGHKRTYLIGLLVFGMGSALCAAAPDGPALIGFRVLQGLGAAVELPATLAILTHTFPEPGERAQAVGIWTGAAGSSLVVGPVLGGSLIAAFGWRAVFVVNLPIVIAVVTLTLVAMGPDSGTSPAGLDLPGQLFGSAALALLTAGAIEGGRQGLSSAVFIGLLLAGILVGAAFIQVERRTPNPMLPLRYFRQPSYAVGNVDGIVMGFINVGLVFVFALFFEQVQGQSALGSGLRFIPWAATFVLVGPAVGRLTRHVGHRLPMTVGCALLAAGVLLLSRVRSESGYGTICWSFVVVGAGYGLLSTPMASVVLGEVPLDRAGMASSTNLAARLVGGVFGVAVLGGLLPAVPSGHAGPSMFVNDIHTGLYLCAVVAILGAALSVRVGPPRSARSQKT